MEDSTVRQEIHDLIRQKEVRIDEIKEANKSEIRAYARMLNEHTIDSLSVVITTLFNLEHDLGLCGCPNGARQEKPSARKRPTIVCLCGSTRFSEAFHEANLRETLAGNIVLSIGCDFKSDADLLLAGELTSEDKARLDELHLRKIDLADEVLFLNVNGYMGESTRREHQYAVNHGKVIRYLIEPEAYQQKGEVTRHGLPTTTRSQ